MTLWKLKRKPILLRGQKAPGLCVLWRNQCVGRILSFLYFSVSCGLWHFSAISFFYFLFPNLISGLCYYKAVRSQCMELLSVQCFHLDSWLDHHHGKTRVRTTWKHKMIDRLSCVSRFFRKQDFFGELVWKTSFWRNNKNKLVSTCTEKTQPKTKIVKWSEILIFTKENHTKFTRNNC